MVNSGYRHASRRAGDCRHQPAAAARGGTTGRRWSAGALAAGSGKFGRDRRAFEKAAPCETMRRAELRFRSCPKAQWKALKQGAGIRRMNDFLALLVLWGILMARSGNQETVYISYPASIKGAKICAWRACQHQRDAPSRCVIGEGFAAVYQRALAFITAAAPHSRQRLNQLPTQQVCRRCDPRDAGFRLNQPARCGIGAGRLRHFAVRLKPTTIWPARRFPEYEDRPTAMPCSSGCVFRQDMFDEDDMRDCAEHFMRLMQAATRA